MPGRPRSQPDTSGIVFGAHAEEKIEATYRMRHDMTPAGDALWRRLRSSRLSGLHFRRQQVIDGFIVDFFCREAGLVVEVDGGVHETTRAYDAERDTVISARGLRVLRFTNDEVLGDITAVLHRIRQEARR